MNDVLKSGLCIGAYAAGLVVGMYGATMVVGSIEQSLEKRRIKKAGGKVEPMDLDSMAAAATVGLEQIISDFNKKTTGPKVSVRRVHAKA